MPSLVLDAIAVLALGGMLAVAFGHPRARVEVGAGTVAAAVVLLTGAVRWPAAREEVRLLLPVVVFLAAILLVAELCATEGMFEAVGASVARASGGRPVRMLLLTFAAAAVVTAVLSLDATVVLLTPVVAAAATGSGLARRPSVFACARLANSASLLLPVSNLTNLLALPSLPSVSFVGFAVLMAPVWLAVLAVEYVGHRLYFARDLAAPRRPGGSPGGRGLPLVPTLVVTVMLVGFAALSPLGVAPAWVAAVAALVLAVHSLRRGRIRPADVVRSAQLPFAWFVLCLGVVVAAVAHTFLGHVVRLMVPSGQGLGSLLAVALLATVLANVVNNLPATLLLVPLVAPLGAVPVLAALIGLGAGSGLTYTGSLANLLWRRTLVRGGERVSARTFHTLSALVTLPAVLAGVLVLAVWAPLVR